MKNNIFLYGVVKSDFLPISTFRVGDLKPERFASGIGDGSPSLVSYRDMAAVVSEAPLVDYKSLPRDKVAKDLVAYQQVLEGILKQTTVIPAKFGTFLEDEDEVKALLESFYHKLEEVLEKFAGKIELDVVALWDNEKIFKNLYAEDHQIRQLQVKITGAKDPQAQLDLKVRLGRRVAEALQKRKEKYLPPVIASLKGCSEGTCHHDLMDEMMILNSSFLLPREQEEDFGEKVVRLDEDLKSELKFRIVGPLPPYSFATLEIKKITDQELAQARELLGLSASGGGEEAGLAEIKRSFRQMAARFHPDHQPVADQLDAQQRFEKINKAYQLLSDYYNSGGESNLVVKVLRLERVI